MKCNLLIMASMIFTMQNTFAAATNGAGAVDEPRVGGALRRFTIDEVRVPRFSEGLKTYMSVSTISTDAMDADGYGKCEGPCGKYNGGALTFKATTDRDDARVLWYMLVRFMPLAKPHGSMDVLKSKVEAKIHFSPDTYREVYDVDFAPQVLAQERDTPFFNLSDDLSMDYARRMDERKIFEWPIVNHFVGARGLQVDGAYNHVTPQDIINGIDTLRTLDVGSGVRRFPLYTLRGIDYYKDALNCFGFDTRALNAFGIRIEGPLSLYLNHDYAAAYRSSISFAFTGPKYLKGERFISGIRNIFFEEGRDAQGGREGDPEELRSFFGDAYPR